jgi:hypothetical protein
MTKNTAPIENVKQMFNETRRQDFIDEESYRNTLAHYTEEVPLYQTNLSAPEINPGGHAHFMKLRAGTLWRIFQLRYTGGDEVAGLVPLMDGVVAGFQQYVEKNDAATDEHYRPPFLMSEFFDSYIQYLHITCAAILLHREDLLPGILGWNAGTDFDGVDAVLEELFKFYFPDRPDLDQWLWDQPYRLLLDAIDDPVPDERAKLMKKFVKRWYPALRGKAGFWGKHEEIEPDFSPYTGYWNMCAAAFTYLYDIDDTSYRDEITYPKDLIDYARSKPRRPVSQENGDPIFTSPGRPIVPT